MFIFISFVFVLWASQSSWILICRKWSINGPGQRPSPVPYTASTYPGFCSMKCLEVFLLPLEGMLVHCSVTPGLNLPVPMIYTPGCWETLRVKYLAQEHNARTPVRAWTQTTCYIAHHVTSQCHHIWISKPT